MRSVERHSLEEMHWQEPIAFGRRRAVSIDQDGWEIDKVRGPDSEFDDPNRLYHSRRAQCAHPHVAHCTRQRWQSHVITPIEHQSLVAAVWYQTQGRVCLRKLDEEDAAGRFQSERHGTRQIRLTRDEPHDPVTSKVDGVASRRQHVLPDHAVDLAAVVECLIRHDRRHDPIGRDSAHFKTVEMCYQTQVPSNGSAEVGLGNPAAPSRLARDSEIDEWLEPVSRRKAQGPCPFTVTGTTSSPGLLDRNDTSVGVTVESRARQVVMK